LELALGLEQVGRAAAVAEAAMVEDQREASLRGEALRERAEPVASRPGEPVGQDDHGRRGAAQRWCGLVHPRGAGVARDVEEQIGSVHALTTPARARA